MIKFFKPEKVIHLAARVGGVKDNVDNPYPHFYENAMVNINVIHACVVNKISHVTAISSNCSFPKDVASYPMEENMLHLGPPEPTNFAFGYAKRMLQIQMEAARRQYGMKFLLFHSSNLYGPHDCFNLERSHVIPALIRKFHEAKRNKDESVKLWGDSRNLRQFTYVDDLARAISKCSEKEIDGDFNFAQAKNCSLGELVYEIKKVVGYDGDVSFGGELGGIYRKDLDTTKLRKVVSLGDMTDLVIGLKRTYDWFLEDIA